MKKIVKAVACVLASILCFTGITSSVFALDNTTPESTYVPIASVGTLDDIDNTSAPYIINHETGQVCFYDLNDFDKTVRQARDGATESITYTGVIAIPNEVQPRISISDEDVDVTYGVEVQLTLNYRSKTERQVKWYVATGASVSYIIMDEQLELEEGILRIGSSGMTVTQDEEFSFSSINASETVGFTTYISEVDPNGIVGAYAEREITRIVSGSSWDFAFGVYKVENNSF